MGGPKTAILAQVVHFYFGAVGHITIGGDTSLQRSDQLLIEGRSREAVQEILWLLETVTTAFKGLDTHSGQVAGKYFNQIAKDLRARRAGTTLDQVLNWISAMHGYLSSPTGGGVRHGADLSSRVDLDLGAARLFCNLTRSYISYLIGDHESLALQGSTLRTDPR